ncbi:MAG: hypothetical protein ACI4QL_01015 [Candidatus Fimimonas sp.]
MVYISLVAIASTIITNVLSFKKMKVALVVYSLAYIFIMAWSAFVLGFYWANDDINTPLINLFFFSTLFDAVSSLSIFQQNSLMLVVTLAILLVAVCLAAAFSGGRMLATKAQNARLKNHSKKSSMLRVCCFNNKLRVGKIYLRLCKFIC